MASEESVGSSHPIFGSISQRRGEDECFWCKQKGHWMKDCPLNPRNKSQPSVPVETPREDSRDHGLSQTRREDKCFCCKQIGHWSKGCPRKKSEPSVSGGVVMDGSDPPVWQCDCGGGACLVFTSRTEKNPGRKFYSCPGKPGGGKCKFFKWCDTVVVSSYQRLDVAEPPYPMCTCGAGKCSLLTSNDGKDAGRKYFACPVRRGQGACNFFQWQDLAGKDSEMSRSHSGESGIASSSDSLDSLSNGIKDAEIETGDTLSKGDVSEVNGNQSDESNNNGLLLSSANGCQVEDEEMEFDSGKDTEVPAIYTFTEGDVGKLNGIQSNESNSKGLLPSSANRLHMEDETQFDASKNTGIATISRCQVKADEAQFDSESDYEIAISYNRGKADVSELDGIHSDGSKNKGSLPVSANGCLVKEKEMQFDSFKGTETANINGWQMKVEETQFDSDGEPETSYTCDPTCDPTKVEETLTGDVGKLDGIQSSESNENESLSSFANGCQVEDGELEFDSGNDTKIKTIYTLTEGYVAKLDGIQSNESNSKGSLPLSANGFHVKEEETRFDNFKNTDMETINACQVKAEEAQFETKREYEIATGDNCIKESLLASANGCEVKDRWVVSGIDNDRPPSIERLSLHHNFVNGVGAWKCSKCGKSHWMKNCVLSLICFKCGKFGHLKKDCTA
ncbi:uncharacterized protein LOC143861883 [Tasmannia lanceolata]|uniref:uncharacterized protein LOC143861883 n=1 Tax=Tasmannia lanceolata TaxID=3420 RepID=UPI004063DD65